MTPLARLLALGITLVLPSCRTYPRSAPPSTTVFFDDFAGDSIDRTKWNVRITGRTVNEEQQAWRTLVDAFENRLHLN